MFINIKILKQLMKTTYKSAGLILAQTEDRYYIAGSRWEMDVKKKYIQSRSWHRSLILQERFRK